MYHYGRWAEVDRIGWVWVPGSDWGPGWVSWRRSSSHIGWAPLPPEAKFNIDIGFNSWVDDYYNIGPSSYRFVEGQNFGSRRLNTVLVDQGQNLSIISETTNITNITSMNGNVHNGGLKYEDLARLSSDPIRRYKLDRRQDYEGDPRYQADDRFRSRSQGDLLSMLTLPVSARAFAPPGKLSEKISYARINRGWSEAGSPEEISALRKQLKSRIEIPNGLPTEATFERVGEQNTSLEKQNVAIQLPERIEVQPQGKMKEEVEANKTPGPIQTSPIRPESNPKINPESKNRDLPAQGKIRKNPKLP